MTPQRRAALISVVAAAGLVALKLTTGLATGSLAFVSEAIHSSTDLVAAVLTFIAVSVAARPADTSHQYGHEKVEHLTARRGRLSAASADRRASDRAARRPAHTTDATWYAFVVIAVVIAIDEPTVVSWRASRRYRARLASSAPTGATSPARSRCSSGCCWRTPTSAGRPIAALFVAALVLAAAGS